MARQVLRRRGIRVSRKRVERLIRQTSLQGAFLRKQWRAPSTRRDLRAARARPTGSTGLHSAVWPAVEQTPLDANMRNFTIFLHGDLLFGYCEHIGEDTTPTRPASPRTRKRSGSGRPCRRSGTWMTPLRPDRAEDGRGTRKTPGATCRFSRIQEIVPVTVVPVLVTW
ncbi:L-rhamnose mutarotase [Saccharothrix sp. ALI-22-I]|uniref:L-rhamnose mutarotase n=1 Tax=Saccharothrix sp. ALI-22-I TaxID=1933778 RepID=UPI001EE7531B|nr:L-rhamnose mutarotase [Saccharothrix sp. ALI-22-I]